MEGSDKTNVSSESKARRVYVSPKALVVKYAGDGSEEGSWMVGRNVLNLVEFMRANLAMDDAVGIYLVEDEERSDPPAEGEARNRMNLIPDSADKDGNRETHSRMRVSDAISMLLSIVTPAPDIVHQFQMDCDMATVRSDMDCAIVTMVFGGKPAGFVFIGSCRDVPVASLGTLYEAAKSQVDRMRGEFRKMAPSIRFSDDPEEPGGGIVLPDGSSPAGRADIATPSRFEEDMAANGMARVVSVV